MKYPRLSVLIVSFNTSEILQSCLDQLFRAGAKLDLQVIVVDNASADDSADMVRREFPQVELIASEVNLGFAAGNNLGFERVKGEFVLLLNPDALVQESSLMNAIAHMQAHPEIGMGGGRLIGKDGCEQPSARQFPSLLNEFIVISGLAARFPKSRFFGRFDRTWDNSGKAVLVDWVPGAFALMRSKALAEVGWFDERFFLYYEEVDLCRRFAEANWQVWYWPDVEVCHWGGESSKTIKDVDFSQSGSQLTLWRMRSELLYYRKHHGLIVTWLVSRLEMGWHLLRRYKSMWLSNSFKQLESMRYAKLMQQAWRETLGGQSSPPRPW